MKNLIDAARVEEVKQRIARLRPDSQRQWGKMNAPQAVAHCSKGLELALGDLRPPRLLLGRIIGPIIKPKVFRNDEPLRRNTPTVEEKPVFCWTLTSLSRWLGPPIGITRRCTNGSRVTRATDGQRSH
jgi:hypothetical protein